METIVYNNQGKEAGKISIPEGIFDLPWNSDLVHEVVRLMNSNARDPIANAKIRGEVRGGGKKPWRQKGTGRARHGSTRSPIWVGGGVAHGPRAEKNFARKINRKAKNKALLTILSRKFRDGEIIFIDSVGITEPKAKDAKAMLGSISKIKGFEKMGSKKKNTAVLAISSKDEAIIKSFGNFGNISVEEVRSINPVSVLNHTYLIVENPESAIKLLSAKTK